MLKPEPHTIPTLGLKSDSGTCFFRTSTVEAKDGCSEDMGVNGRQRALISLDIDPAPEMTQPGHYLL